MEKTLAGAFRASRRSNRAFRTSHYFFLFAALNLVTWCVNFVFFKNDHVATFTAFFGGVLVIIYIGTLWHQKRKSSCTMPGITEGVVKFTRKPAKMGDDHIFWIPRVYLKNGLVDPACEYEVYLKKKE